MRTESSHSEGEETSAKQPFDSRQAEHCKDGALRDHNTSEVLGRGDEVKDGDVRSGHESGLIGFSGSVSQLYR